MSAFRRLMRAKRNLGMAAVPDRADQPPNGLEGPVFDPAPRINATWFTTRSRSQQILAGRTAYATLSAKEQDQGGEPNATTSVLGARWAGWQHRRSPGGRGIERTTSRGGFIRLFGSAAAALPRGQQTKMPQTVGALRPDACGFASSITALCRCYQNADRSRVSL